MVCIISLIIFCFIIRYALNHPEDSGHVTSTIDWLNSPNKDDD